MEPSTDPLRALGTFRDSFYDECLHRRADALFELTDALLSAGGRVPSPAHLRVSNHRTAAAGEAFTPRSGGGGSKAKLCVGCSPPTRSSAAEAKKRPSTPWT
ncbi:MAG: hypothetical protein LC674_06005 [Actinobacteria bacterium]|nr:hypothetical protein [Actinomycetota bacterium]